MNPVIMSIVLFPGLQKYPKPSWATGKGDHIYLFKSTDNDHFTFLLWTGDHLQFVFTNVDSKAHDRSFYLTIKIDNNRYQGE